MSRVAVVCPEDVIVISHFCLLFIVFVPDGISLLCSADEESPYLLFGLKEGQDRLILITSNGGFGLWFQDWKMSNVFHFSCPSQTERVAVSVLMNTLCKAKKSLTVNQFFFSFVFSSCSIYYIRSVWLFCSACWTFFPQKLFALRLLKPSMKTFIILLSCRFVDMIDICKTM